MFKPAFLKATKVSGLLVFGPIVPMIEVLLKLEPVSVCKLDSHPSLDSIVIDVMLGLLIMSNELLKSAGEDL